MPRSSPLCTARGRTLDFRAGPVVMGILNVTPDSFSDGGQHNTIDAALAHAWQLIAEGAHLLDIGGESTRPGSQPVSEEEELRRVVPVVEALTNSGKLGEVLLSIDTSKSAVAAACLERGAHIINDVTALQGDPAMPAIVKQLQAGAILMHMQGTPATMQLAPHYDDVVAEVDRFFEARLQASADFGIARSCLMLDPGMGFGKTEEHNWELLARLAEFQKHGRPVCLGVSRKGFLGKPRNRPVHERLPGSLAVALDAVAHDAAQLLRVHDVAATRDAVRVLINLTDRREKRH